MELISQKQYFVLHAARQTGKTTLLLDLVKQLNESGAYYALYCSLESVQGISEAEKGIPAIVRNLVSEVTYNSYLANYSFNQKLDFNDYNNLLKNSLIEFCGKADKPVVILFDEVDCLSNSTLITFLRQLRDGYVNRSRIPFVQSMALVGMRNIRDYRAKIRDDKNTPGSASPFNIVSDSLTLSNFSKSSVTDLVFQHTRESGQKFSSSIINQIYFYTRGQPWLVNAICREIVNKILLSDYSQEVLVEYVDQAAQTVISRRDTHIDSLLERLKEQRVQKIIEPLILGESGMLDMLDDDLRYVLDLGLIEQKNKKLVPANPIYAEVIMRVLTYRSQMEMNAEEYPPEIPAYVEGDKLDMKRLLTDFQQFWRENSEIWIERYQYKEAAPHLILQAFLQRILNNGGWITREMAAGTRRLDLCVHFQQRRYPIELKLRYHQKTYAEGQKQLGQYLDKLGLKEGWLLVFDRRKGISWKRKLFWRTKKENNKQIHTIGL